MREMPLARGRRRGLFKRVASRVTRWAGGVYARYFGPSVRSVRDEPEPRFLALLRTAAEDGPPGPRDRAQRDSVLAHFRDRTAGNWPEVPDTLTDLRLDLGSLSDAELQDRAARALQGDFHPSGVRAILKEDGRVDWSSNPAGRREWLLMLHRHAWWALWAECYRRTQDEVYARAFVSQITDWIEQHPLPARHSEDHEPWRLMEAGLRLRLSWIPAFGVFYRSAAFTDAAKIRVLRALYDHGRLLNTFFTNRNHLIRECNGLLTLALCFPEFAEADEWLFNGMDRIDREIRNQVNRDGSHIEMSVGYQWLAIDEFEVTRTLLEDNDLALPNVDIEYVLRQMYAYLASVIRPDGSFPQLNDGFILWDVSRMLQAATRAGWRDIEYIGSGCARGEEPEFCSRSFPNAGLHVTRSHWGRDAHYLVADTGPYGGPHGHEDKLSFELCAFGEPFIVDPGSYTYQKGDPYRLYFVGSQGHNTVLVDGKSQVRRWSRKHMNPRVSDRTYGEWYSDPDWDYASGRYDEGYAEFSLSRPAGRVADEDVTHRRDFVFAKPDYWVIIDSLVATRDHDFEFVFHLAPDIEVRTLDGPDVVLVSRHSGARLLLKALADGPICCDVMAGSESPIQGWYSPDHHQKCPAPTLVFRSQGRRTMCVPWLLFPLPSDCEADEIGLVRAESRAPGECSFVVTGRGGRDSFSVHSRFAAGGLDDEDLEERIVIRRQDGRTWSSDRLTGGDA